jgi:hypothetical protein
LSSNDFVYFVILANRLKQIGQSLQTNFNMASTANTSNTTTSSTVSNTDTTNATTTIVNTTSTTITTTRKSTQNPNFLPVANKIEGDNKYIIEAYQEALVNASLFMNLHCSTLLPFAKQGYKTCGRGYVNVVFENFLYLNYGDTLRYTYHNVECINVTNVKAHLPLIDMYDPETEFVLLIVMPMYDKPHNYTRYACNIVNSKTVIEYFVKCGIPLLAIEECKKDQECFDALCSTNPMFNKYTNIKSEKPCKEPVQKLMRTEGLLLRHEAALLNLGGISHEDCLFKCATCEKKKNKNEIKKCGACHMVVYCSKECAVKDWKKHKELCKLWK